MRILRNLRWSLVAATLAVGLALLLGGNALFHHLRVDNPLQTALGQDPDVLSYRLDTSGAQPVLHVRLADVPDLAEAYERVATVAGGALGPADHFTLMVEDRRTPALGEAYHTLHFDLQEGLQRGTYAAMAQRIAAEAPALGVQRERVTVGQDKLFVQLHAGNGYLYAVLPRTAQGGEQR